MRPPSQVSIDTSHPSVLSKDTPFCVLLVEDQTAVRLKLAKDLHTMGVSCIHQAATAQQALDLFQQHRPNLVLLDIHMPGGHDGYWAAQRMRESEPGGWTPIIFLSGMSNELDVWRGIESGGDDYLVKPITPIVLAAKLRAMRRLQTMHQQLVHLSDELHKANDQLSALVEVDGLTGLVNRRGLDRILHAEIVAARREGQPLTLMLCDLDYFKRYNDRLGHLQGDRCLQHISRVLHSVCHRPRDVAARYGGEEFALILPHTPRSGAMTFARALGKLLQENGITHPDSPTAAHVTLSGGITTCIPDANTSAEGMLRRADEALYAAKSQGRNRFFSFEMQMDTITQRHP